MLPGARDVPHQIPHWASQLPQRLLGTRRKAKPSLQMCPVQGRAVSRCFCSVSQQAGACKTPALSAESSIGKKIISIMFSAWKSVCPAIALLRELSARKEILMRWSFLPHRAFTMQQSKRPINQIMTISWGSHNEKNCHQLRIVPLMALQARYQQSLQLLIPSCGFTPAALSVCAQMLYAFQGLLFFSVHPSSGPP